METSEFKILDHGYLKYIEHWGSDERIIEAARMSTDKGFLGWGPKRKCTRCGNLDEMNTSSCSAPGCMACSAEHVQGDEKLLKYLYDNKHATPFEMAGLVIEVKAPIMVFREWHRHRTQSYNEMSARYVPLPDENYVPTVDRLLVNSKLNKQAGVIKGADELGPADAEEFQNELIVMYGHQEAFYQKWLKRGVPKELARVDLPVGRYSKMRACANLRNWLSFLTLRMDTKAQQEIRLFANAVGEIIEAIYPRTWELFIAGKGS